MRFRRALTALMALCLAMMAVPALQAPAEAASKYYITVDRTNQIVTVYDSGNVTNSGIVRQMICSTGKSSTPTPAGTFYLPAKSRSSERSEWYYFSEYKCYAKWATRIRGGILFHSVLYSAAKKGPTSASVNALGSPASHGCIRLRVADAKWIAQNCPAGTKCKIYSSGKTNSTLRKKLKSKTFSRASQTYDSFLGKSSSGSSTAVKQSTLPLSKGSTGALVTQLQTRLRTLGFLNDTVDGIFGANTLAAVQSFQAAAGLKATTKVDQALWTAIFADGAPTGTAVALSEGSSGPAVATLQRALIALKLLDGKADGAYGPATAAAVRRYQQGTGAAATGAASAALQKAILARAGEVKSRFGDGDYMLVGVTTEVQMARVKVSSSLNLRETASTSGKILATLKNGTELIVVSRSGGWVRVVYGAYTGYVSEAYVTFFTVESTTLDYADSITIPEVVIELPAVRRALTLEGTEPSDGAEPDAPGEADASAEEPAEPAPGEDNGEGLVIIYEEPPAEQADAALPEGLTLAGE